MKTIQHFKDKIKEVFEKLKNLPMHGSEKEYKRQLDRCRKEVAYYNSIILYLEHNPSEESILKQESLIKKTIDNCNKEISEISTTSSWAYNQKKKLIKSKWEYNKNIKYLATIQSILY